jgi:signal transduction histidine kinase
VSRVPIRLRLTAAFALTTALVLAAAGLFVYLHLESDLTEAVDETLRAQAEAVAATAGRQGPASSTAGVATGDPEEGFAQLLTGQGRILDATGGAKRPALSAAELEPVAAGPLVAEREVPGIEGDARILALPIAGENGAGGGPAIAIAGQSLADRDETLSGVVASFAVGGPLAVLLASLLGYALAAAGFRPVEAMRRRAAQVSLARRDERLPLPAARDEIHRLGETLNEMLARLRRSFERERRLVADASHELRTPVAVVKAELEGALRTSDCGPRTREALVAAVEECDRLAQLAEDLLVLARAGDGRLPVRSELVDARDLLGRTRERFADRAGEHGRRIDVDAPEGLALRADPLRLRQALGNLVDNALRHGAGGIVLAARPASGGVDLEVRDQGTGFGDGLGERAFERFTRGDEARGRGGAGLGLAIVRAIAAAHGGRVAIVPAAGTTVRLWLPDAPAGHGRQPVAPVEYTNR